MQRNARDTSSRAESGGAATSQGHPSLISLTSTSVWMAPLLKGPWNQNSSPCKSKTTVRARLLSGVRCKLKVRVKWFLPHVFTLCLWPLLAPLKTYFVFLSASHHILKSALVLCFCSEAWNHGEAASASRFRHAAGTTLGPTCWQGSWTLPRMGGGTQSRGTWWKSCISMDHLMCTFLSF